MSQVNRISKTGLELIKGFEGLRRRSEPLQLGGWIVGYGHTRSAREGVEVTEREAEYLLRYDLQDIEQYVSHHVHAPLNQNEFDALVSFCWNIGKDAFSTSDVLNYVNAGEMLAAAESFSAWRKARIGGRLIVVDALVRRRTAEKNLFLSHPSGPPAAPSLVVRPELDVAASVLALSDGALSLEAKMNTPQRTPVQTALPNVAANDRFFERKMPENVIVDVEDTEAVEDVIDEGLDLVSDENDHVSSLAGLDINDDASLSIDLDDVEDDELDEIDDLPAFVEVSDDSDNDVSLAEAAEENETLGSVWDETDVDTLEKEDDATDEDFDLDLADSYEEDDESDLESALDDLAELDDDSEGEESLARAMTAAALADEQSDIKELDHDDEADVPGVFLNEEQEEKEPTQLEIHSNLGDDTEKTAFVSEHETTEWHVEDDDAVLEHTDVQAETVEPRLVLNDIDYPNGMTAEEIEALGPDGAFPHAGAKSSRNIFLSILPFLLLAIIGLVMMGLGLFDWWELLKSDKPINENELYAGPFLTLIGGFGLVFGLYFTIRKLVVKDR